MQRQAHVVIAGCLAALAAAEWIRSDAALWAVLAALAAVAAFVVAVRPPGPRPKVALAAALVSLVLGFILATGAFRIWRIECCWPAVREASVATTSRALQQSLGWAIGEARRLAERGATAGGLPRTEAFDRLRDAVGGRQAIERGLVII